MSEDVKIPLPRSLQEIVGSLLFASQDPLTPNELRDAIKGAEVEEIERRAERLIIERIAGGEGLIGSIGSIGSDRVDRVEGEGARRDGLAPREEEGDAVAPREEKGEVGE